MRDAISVLASPLQEVKKLEGKFAEYTVNELNWMLANSKRLDPQCETPYSLAVMEELNRRGAEIEAKVGKITDVKPLPPSPLPIDNRLFDELKKSDKKVPPAPELAINQIVKSAAPQTVYVVFLRQGKKGAELLGAYSTVEKAIAVCTSSKHYYSPVIIDEENPEKFPFQQIGVIE